VAIEAVDHISSNPEIPSFCSTAPQGPTEILELLFNSMLLSPSRIAIRQSGPCRRQLTGTLVRKISTSSPERADTLPPPPTARTLSTVEPLQGTAGLSLSK